MAPPVKDVSVADFADMLGREPARIYQLIQEGLPHRKRGKKSTRIVPREAIAWLIDRAKEQAAPKSATPRARERRELAEAELKEITVMERRQALIPIGEVEAFVDALVGGFAAVAAGRLQRFERDMVASTSPGEARKITEDIHTALMAGAQEYREQLEHDAATLEAAVEAAAVVPPAGAEAA